MYTDFENMPETIQEWYKSTNFTRKIALWLCIAIIPVLCILFLLNGFIEGITDFFQMLIMSVYLPGFLYGFVHFGWILKYMWERFKVTIVIPPLFIILFGFPIMAIMLVGGVFIIIDAIRFIKKKPLVYSWEAKVVEKI
ncbi:MAG: hypothetical protein NC485_01490 [Ruminococcus flavefaciens]|nr:hypothetical protein [Ruminococcus flavefaciens]MCM1058682.1 hypothetical protein [Eubacterium sp.]